MNIVRYDSNLFGEWNAFVKSSKNGTFLFDRSYMDYHADRFSDNSLLVLSDSGKTIAILPANRDGDILASHGGLTYGGMVVDESMRIVTMLEIFDELSCYCREHGIRRIVYKAIPHIYHRLPAEEDLYALFRNGARIFRRDLSTAIDCSSPVKRSENRLRGAKKAHKSGVFITESQDYETFFSFHAELLQGKYGQKPAHIHEEMSLLAGRFPENIKLSAAMDHEQMLAGVIVYESETCAHFQYISSTDAGKERGALDLLLTQLIDHYLARKRFISFGVSTENQGTHLNAGLVHQKEQFGARAVVHDFYELVL